MFLFVLSWMFFLSLSLLYFKNLIYCFDFEFTMFWILAHELVCVGDDSFGFALQQQQLPYVWIICVAPYFYSMAHGWNDYEFETLVLPR